MKILKRVALLVLCAVVTFWLGSLLACEYDTYRYGEQFRMVLVHDISGERFLEDKTIKVLKYDGTTAEIYALFRDGGYKTGDLYWFERDGDQEWVNTGWDSVWSTGGNADDYVFPYVRLEGFLCGHCKG